MRVEELRVGNLVQTLNNDFFDGDAIDWSLDMFYWVAECVYNIEDFKPIPLTEEILLDCGFSITCDPENVHYKINVCNEYNEKFVINRKVGYDVFYIQHKDCNDYLHFTTQIKHVHQLQNLFHSITGQELEFKTLGV